MILFGLNNVVPSCGLDPDLLHMSLNLLGSTGELDHGLLMKMTEVQRVSETHEVS